MNKVFLLLGLFVQLRVSGQKGRFFAGVAFDSSYTVVGICQGYGKQVDSLERFWFVLDNPEDMKQLQRDWQFKKRANLPGLDFVSFDVYVIQGKRVASGTGLIIPRWGISATRPARYPCWLISIRSWGRWRQKGAGKPR
jgi:hypothetical protein